MRESEQHRFENMRSLLDDKARELITFQKQLRQQIARLVSRIDSSSCHFLKYLYGVIFSFWNESRKKTCSHQTILSKKIDYWQKHLCEKISRSCFAPGYCVRQSQWPNNTELVSVHIIIVCNWIFFFERYSLLLITAIVNWITQTRMASSTELERSSFHTWQGDERTCEGF